MTIGLSVEFELELEISGFKPPVPAKVSGPPESCYPSEPMEYDIDGGNFVFTDHATKKVKKIPIPRNILDEIMCENGEAINDAVEGHMTAKNESDREDAEIARYEAKMEDRL